MLSVVNAKDSRPNIILVMADDQGWGQVGYYQHPTLKTPNIDAMAANGLRFDRFYAGAPNCSPTRATVMTGRTNDRTGVLNHGVPMRPQERTVAQALKSAGYATGHFGKWHLNGMRGVGAPIFADDPRSPGAFGFDTWISVTNFFDRNPLLSRNGHFEEFTGDSSEIIVDLALDFARRQQRENKPFFAVVWYGSPHSPWLADEQDRASFTDLKKIAQHHYGELVAMDRSIGTLRRGLREMGIAEKTLLWYCSDNGGLRQFGPETVGGLRGAKNTMYEGGLRVPCVIEWPAVIRKARITRYPAVTMDIFPTLAEIAGLEKSAILEPQDGVSLRPLFTEDRERREKPIPFRHTNRAALVDNQFKIIQPKIGIDKYELYDLENDPQETRNLIDQRPDIANKLRKALGEFNTSVQQSLAGADYPEGKVIPPDPGPRNWTQLPQYRPYFDEWKKRPEFRSRLK